MGAKIHKSARVRFGTILRAKVVEIGPHASIGPFAYIRAESFRAGPHSLIKPLTICKASTVALGAYAHIAPTAIISADLSPRSSFILGDHSRIFPFCWLEPGEGITIGKQTAVGGHSLIFTHGAWQDYLEGGQVTYGPVVLEDNVWLAWRVLILANVTIGENAVVAAGSVINKSVPANSLAAGVPAKVIANVRRKLTDEERTRRAQRILADYADRGVPASENPAPRLRPNRLQFSSTIAVDEAAGLGNGDLLFVLDRTLNDGERQSFVARGVTVADHSRSEIFIASPRPYIMDFTGFLRRYGIRLYVRSCIKSSRL